jgi:hypothetical protein
MVVAILLTGCGVTVGEAPPALEPIAAGEVGPVFPRPGGNGPPIECRQLARDRCLRIGTIEDGTSGVDLVEVDRVIVSCIGRCTPDGGEFRIDVVIDSETRAVGRGGYGEFEQ